jgi:hypothetical protein
VDEVTGKFAWRYLKRCKRVDGVRVRVRGGGLWKRR